MDIVNLYDKYFSQDIKYVFEKLKKIANDSGVKIYLIGGLVRDMLLNVPSLDIDITVEGSAIELAKILEKNSIAKIKSIHKDFGTVKIMIDDINIDLASTRGELYPQAGHLPVITEIGCLLKDDILRRDFSINSLALSLNKNDFLQVVDYVNGLEDLKNKKIKVLHDKSFIDDPTRILRALKYANRLNFSLDEKTKTLQDDYLKNINYNMGYKRILQEFKKTFSEKNPPYKEFIEQNVYKLVNSNDINFYDNKDYNLSWIGYFALVAPDDIDNFQLTKTEKCFVEGTKCLENKSFETDFDIYKAFCAFNPEVAIVLAAKGNLYAQRYINNFMNIKIETTGQDLIEMGIKPSKEFGEIFDFIIKEKINSPNLTKSEELLLIKNQFML